MKKLLIMALMVCSFWLTSANSYAQQGLPPQPDLTITTTVRTAVIQETLKALREKYVFPDVAEKMATTIQQRLNSKEYAQITSAKQLAETLTADLQAISKDKHLNIRYQHDPIPERTERTTPTKEEQQRYINFVNRVNFGFERVERLPGNIGYLDLRGFMDPELGGETAAAAMNFLANTNALIIDLRKNGGGSPAMVALLCSYLFNGEPVHLNDLYWRAENRTQQWWTMPFVPGKRYIDKDVYILTSNRTFSAAEEFTYNLKNLKRATIVGETTGGGAHPGEFYRLNEHFAMFLPTGRAINPITKTNWEGTGITPDVAVTADEALKTAQLIATKKIIAQTSDDEFRQALRLQQQNLEKELVELKKLAK